MWRGPHRQIQFTGIEVLLGAHGKRRRPFRTTLVQRPETMYSIRGILTYTWFGQVVYERRFRAGRRRTMLDAQTGSVARRRIYVAAESTKGIHFP